MKEEWPETFSSGHASFLQVLESDNDRNCLRIRASERKIQLLKGTRCAAVFILLLTIFCSITANGQLILHGMVVDSASMQSLSNVNIRIKTTGPGVISDIRGAFQLKATESDTIVFSRVGYITRTIPATVLSRMVIVFLKEERRMLELIEVQQTRPVWLPEIPPESPWQNPTNNRKTSETPGQPLVQTFGPGYVIKGPFSRFSKEEKEKRKLQRVREENYRSRNYVLLVNDPEVKGRIMKDYGLNEEQYYEGLANFNHKNKDIIYRLERDEVISLLVLFFSESKTEK